MHLASTETAFLKLWIYDLKFIISDYLKNRKNIVSDSELMEFNIGVPQRSSLGPTLWLLIENELLRNYKGKDYRTVIYVDDIVVLMKSNASFHFTELSNEPIKDIVSWCDKYHLYLSIDKILLYSV